MKIFVGNLSFRSTDSDIRPLFEAHGQVDEVVLVTDRETGRPRGFGFVTMPNSSEAEAAISAIHGRELDGRALNVNEARARESGGGGGGRGGRNRGW